MSEPRSRMFRLRAISFLLIAVAACAAESPTPSAICDDAITHVSMCTGVPEAELVGPCDAAQSGALLSQSCDELAADASAKADWGWCLRFWDCSEDAPAVLDTCETRIEACKANCREHGRTRTEIVECGRGCDESRSWRCAGLPDA